VKVWTGQPRTGVIEHVASAYLVVVAIDEYGRLKKVPPIKPEGPNEVRRYEDALSRREHRERERARRKAARQVIRDDAAIAAARPTQVASK
jgi:acyl-CoA hydrolase